MRQFGKDAPDFFAFKIGEDSEEIYKIPLAASLTNREIIAFEETKDDYTKQVKWLKNFMGDAVLDLTAAETGRILTAWSEESKKQGAEPGE